MKQKKIAIIMAGILAAAAAMTGCAEQNKTATQVDYTQNAQGKSEQTKQKTAEKSQPDKKQVNKSTSGGKENSNQTADKKTKVFASSNNAGDVQNSGNDADNTDDSQNTYVDNNSSENNGSTGDGGNQIDQTADQAMIYDSEGNGRLISQADDGNWYDSDGNCYGSWEDIGRAMDEDGVTDQDGNKWRLLERQYSSGGDDVLKRLLIDKLIQGDYIDGYKIVGASCHEANAFVDIHGNSLSDKKFEIDCDLELEDTLSYQDSFKWYSYNLNKAYNYENSHFSYNLDTTDLNLYGDTDDDDDDREWDDYHQYHCSVTRSCYRNGREIWVDVNNLDDFIWIESKGEYHHEDDCVCCDECGTNILLDDAMCSEVTEEYYCCKECMEKVENEFKRKNWHYSEYDDEWYEDYTDITRINIWNEPEGIYESKSIGTDTLCRLLRNEEAWEFDNEVFDKVNPSTNLPYGYKLKKEINHEYTIIEAAV